MKKQTIIPLGDRVLVEALTQDGKTESGIIIPDTASKERPQEGKVIAIGEGRTTDDGTIIPMNIKKGDIVLFSKYGPEEIKIEGKEYYIINESNVLAVIKN